MRFDFEWDPQKAKQNVDKHGITFELASTVFRDPLALSLYDEDHSASEDRWITLGISSTGALLVVHHTYAQADAEMATIRIISSRKAIKKEQEHYKG